MMWPVGRLVSVILLAALVFLGLRFFAESGQAPSAAPRLAPAPLPSSIEQQITAVDQALAQAQRSGKPVPITLTLTEQDLTRAAAGYFPQTAAGVTVSDPIIHLGSGRLLLTGSGAIAFARGELAATATPLVVNGRPVVRVDSATVAGVALPDFVTQAVGSAIQSALDSALPAKLQVTSIVVGTGTLTVQGVANP